MLELTSRMARCSGVAAFSSTMACTRPSVSRNDAPVIGGVIEFGAQNRGRRFTATVRIEQRCQSFRPQQRRVARNHDARAWRSCESRAARPAWRGRCRAAAAARRAVAPSAVATAPTSSAWWPTTTSICTGFSGWQARTTCSRSGRPAGAMQHFGELGTHARSLARGQNDDGGVMAAVMSQLLSPSPRSFSNGKARIRSSICAEVLGPESVCGNRNARPRRWISR